VKAPTISTQSRPAPRRSEPPRQTATAPVPPPVVAPAPAKQNQLDDYSVKIIRGAGKAEELKFPSDSNVRRDSTARRP
jgi:hypothetical protein